MPSLLAAGAAPYVPPPAVPVPPAPTIAPFGRPAPAPTPYGAFTAPDQATFARSADSMFLQDQQQKALQRSAAARGSLLSGGLLTRLQSNAAGNASQDYGNAFTRALQAYTANRDTNAQNFGQSTQQFQGDLGAFGANTNAALGAGKLALDTQQVQYDQGRQGALDTQANTQNQNIVNASGAVSAQQASDAAYAAQVDAARRQNEAISASLRKPTAAPIGAFGQRPGPVPSSRPGLIGRG